MQATVTEVIPSGDPERSYEVITGQGFDDSVLRWITGQPKPVSKIFILTEDSLKDIVLPQLLDAISSEYTGPVETITFAGSEKNKSLSSLEGVYNELIRKGVDRSSLLIAAGGGVTGDFGGFVAATILRGIRFIQIPTTLLAMVDSSVGGKVAVNAGIGKNMVGAFYQPGLVYCNLSYLKTLPEREWICGLAEMAKHAMLSPNPEVFHYLFESAPSVKDPAVLQKAVSDSIGVKAAVVCEDEKETGLRATLNLGHTTAHAIESLTGYVRFLHGEAVSRGLITALLLSSKIAGLSETDCERSIELMQKLGLPSDTASLSADDLLEHMKFDKKNESGRIKFVLLKSPGNAGHGYVMNPDDFKQAWNIQKERFG